MLAGLRKTAPPTEFELAKARFAEKSAARNALIDEANARRIGLSLSRGDDADKDRCAYARKIAGQFRRLAERRPEVAAQQLRDLEFQIEEGEAEFRNEVDLFNAAKRRESNRIAQELVPDHRKAVSDIAAAFESLSRAVEAERAVRLQFARRAPEPQSRLLPHMSSGIGAIGQWDSMPARWCREARQQGFF